VFSSVVALAADDDRDAIFMQLQHPKSVLKAPSCIKTKIKKSPNPPMGDRILLKKYQAM